MGDKIPLQVIKKALKETGLDHIVNAFPQKEDTTVGKEYDANGIVFSGGQKQQLAIAAAYCKDAEIYLFDEPSAALDPEAEARMFDNLFKISKDKTVECYTISAVDKAPKIWYNKEQETRKEGKEDGTLSKIWYNKEQETRKEGKEDGTL